MTGNGGERLLTPTQAAAYADVKLRTFHKWAAGREWVVSCEEVGIRTATRRVQPD